jgi:hydrogenase expression/formation protein HypC
MIGARCGHGSNAVGPDAVCLTFPGRVVAVDEDGATVELQGRMRRASTLVAPDVTVGDWVLVGAGTILERLDPGRAEAMAEGAATALRDAPLPGDASRSPASRPT